MYFYAIQQTPENSPGMNVLIIDDDPIIRHAYAHYLNHRDYTTYQANNGIEGLKMLNDNPEISKVILDAYMPEMDAFAFLRHIQDDAVFKTKHPDIYFISSWNRDHIQQRLDRENIDQANIKVVFQKPIDLGVLLEMLQN